MAFLLLHDLRSFYGFLLGMPSGTVFFRSSISTQASVSLSFQAPRVATSSEQNPVRPQTSLCSGSTTPHTASARTYNLFN